MSTNYPMSFDVARHEINRRLRDADDERRRRLARRASAPRPRFRTWIVAG